VKKTHIAALACFAAAVLFYVLGSSGKGAGAALFLGMIFELMGWLKLFGSKDETK